MDLTDIPNGTDVTPLLLKRVIWDLVPNKDINDSLRRFNFVLDSHDVADMERKDQEARHAALDPINGWIYILTQLAANVMHDYLTHSEYGIEGNHFGFAMGVTNTVITELIDNGFLHINHAMVPADG